MVYVAVAERAGTEFVTADARLRARLAHLGWVKLPGEPPGPCRAPPGSGDRTLHTVVDKLHMREKGA